MRGPGPSSRGRARPSPPPPGRERVTSLSLESPSAKLRDDRQPAKEISTRPLPFVRARVEGVDTAAARRRSGRPGRRRRRAVLRVVGSHHRGGGGGSCVPDVESAHRRRCRSAVRRPATPSPGLTKVTWCFASENTRACGCPPPSARHAGRRRPPRGTLQAVTDLVASSGRLPDSDILVLVARSCSGDLGLGPLTPCRASLLERRLGATWT